MAALVAAAITVASLLAITPAGAVQVYQDKVVSANPADFTPHIIDPAHANFAVFSFAQIGDRIYVGGPFTQIQGASGGPVYTTSGLFAFDRNTGEIDVSGFGFPGVSGRITTLEASPDGNLFVAGNFAKTDGKTTKKIGKLDATNGQVMTVFKAKADKQINDMVYRGGLLYLAGAFTTVDNVARSGLAAVDPTTGALSGELNLPVAGTRKTGKLMHVDSLDVTPDASTLLATGNFTTVNSLSRNQVALVDLTTSPDTVRDWQTNRYVNNCASKFDTYIRDVDFSPDGSYFIITTTGASAIIFGTTPTTGGLCDSTTRWPTNAVGAGQQPTWVAFTGGDTNYSAAATGTAIYLGGHQRWQNNYWGRDSAGPASVSRAGIGALSPLNGMPLSWNPGRTRGLGAQALLATDQGLWVGSDTDDIGGEYHAKIALMPLAGGSFVPAANSGTVPGELYTIEQDGDLMSRAYDGSTFAGPQLKTAINWSSARGAFMLSGTLYTGWSDGHLYRQLLNDNFVGTQKEILLRGLETETNQLPNMASQLTNASGMFFDDSNGRLYYTVSGDPKLYYRNFLPESDLLGDYRFTACTWSATPASNTCGGLNPGAVRGMTLANGTLYFGQADGTLSTVGFTSGTQVDSFGSVGATATVISGPGIDGNDWNSRGLFFRSDA